MTLGENIILENYNCSDMVFLQIHFGRDFRFYWNFEVKKLKASKYIFDIRQYFGTEFFLFHVFLS